MNVEETVRSSLINYPSIFPNALSVYDHYFLVIGNGMEWRGGELVDLNIYSESPLAVDIRSGILKVVEDSFDFLLRVNYSASDQIAKRVIVGNRSRIKEGINLIFDTETRLTDFTPLPDFKFSEITKYAKILNLPPDITSSWLQAARKMYELLEKHKNLIPNPEQLERIKEELKKYETA